MGSETVKLTIIDFSNLKNRSEPWNSVKAQVREASEEYGCFEATFNEIPLHLLKSVIDVAKQLFDLPLPVKLRNFSDILNHGYIKKEEMPLFESFGIPDALSPGNVDAFTNLMWPEGNISFSSKILESFSKQLSDLDKLVRRMVVESLGLDKYMEEHMDSTNYLLRVQKYDKPQSQGNIELGLPSHKDKNIVSILYQNEINGLQILTKDGHWFTAQPSFNSFVVLIGESFSAWTNGRLHIPCHRVMMSGDEARYTFALFSVPKEGFLVKAPEEMVDEDHPLLYKPFDHDKFLDFCHTEAGRRSPNPLKEYCGV